AVASIAKDIKPVWVAAAMTDGDRVRAEVARRNGEKLITPGGKSSDFMLRFVTPDPDTYHKYYNIISNPLLWFLQHYLWETSRAPDIDVEIWDAWNNGYVTVNKMFADEILTACEESVEEPIIMLQDYQLYLTAGYIREKRP